MVGTVQEALALARRNNPDLVNARQNRLVQDQQRAVAQASLLPQARFFTNFDYNFALPVQLVPAEFLVANRGSFVPCSLDCPTSGRRCRVTVPILNRPARADLGIVEQNLRIIDHQTLVLQDEMSTQTARLYHAVLLTRSAIALPGRTFQRPIRSRKLPATGWTED